MWAYLALPIGSATLIGGFVYMSYKEGKDVMEGGLRRLGIDPKDVRFGAYVGQIYNSKSSSLYPADCDSNPQTKKTIEIAKSVYLRCGPEERNPEKFVEVLFKSMTPQERLGIIKKKERNKYQFSSVFQETFNIQPSSLVQG